VPSYEKLGNIKWHCPPAPTIPSKIFETTFPNLGRVSTGHRRGKWARIAVAGRPFVQGD
jgi:hypothetical protein